MTLPSMFDTGPGQRGIIWVRQSVYHQGIEIGVGKEIFAHSVPVPDKPGEETHVKTQYFDATVAWKEAQWGTPQLQNPEPLLTLKYQQAQELMEQLWAAGVRPTQAAGSIGQLAAVEKHLADMRALTAHVLQAKLP